MIGTLLTLTALGLQFCTSPSACSLHELLHRGVHGGYLWVLSNTDEEPDFADTVLFPEYRNVPCHKAGVALYGSMQEVRFVWFCRPDVPMS